MDLRLRPLDASDIAKRAPVRAGIGNDAKTRPTNVHCTNTILSSLSLRYFVLLHRFVKVWAAINKDDDNQRTSPALMHPAKSWQ